MSPEAASAGVMTLSALCIAHRESHCVVSRRGICGDGCRTWRMLLRADRGPRNVSTGRPIASTCFCGSPHTLPAGPRYLPRGTHCQSAMGRPQQNEDSFCLLRVLLCFSSTLRLHTHPVCRLPGRGGCTPAHRTAAPGMPSSPACHRRPLCLCIMQMETRNVRHLLPQRAEFCLCVITAVKIEQGGSPKSVPAAYDAVPAQARAAATR